MSEAKSVVWLTVSKALVKSRDTVTVLCGGMLGGEEGVCLCQLHRKKKLRGTFLLECLNRSPR